MTTSFYYELDGGVRRVEADTFTQVTQGGQPGQCNDVYAISWAWVYLSKSSGWQLSLTQFAGGYPPFEIYVTGPGETNRFTGDVENRSRAALIVHDENGNVVPPSGYNQPGSNRRRKGYPAYMRLARGSRNSYPRRYSPGSEPSGWRQATGETYPNPVDVDVSVGDNFYVSGGTPPDDCGGGGTCQTKFYRGDIEVYSINACPEISEEPPQDDCKDCCRLLLPIARSIRV